MCGVSKLTVSPLTASRIDSVEALKNMATKLQSVTEIAIDLEAHSYRSFAGIVCLMQVSIRTADGVESFLVDTLNLQVHLNDALAAVLANPAIVKVLHGADTDIAWLQRDFGLYIVNLFDAGRAAHALKFSLAGLAYLLQRYVHDLPAMDMKEFQMADWRQRPLTEEMQQYAIHPTGYCYVDLWTENSTSNASCSLVTIFDRN
jgi:exosome complex exonuclease RRP6